jgi:glycerate kinase
MNWISGTVCDPLGREIVAKFGLLGDQAVIEMSRASGLALLDESERNPWFTSTFGTGQMMKVACEYGAKRILCCIGGSATNDGGVGMAAALGFEFFKDERKIEFPVGKDLAEITEIRAPVEKFGASVVVACDVRNPLLGENGATNVFGPQKGAKKQQDRDLLEKGLENLSRLWIQQFGKDVANVPGAGAAGGLGAGLISFLGAELKPGFDLVADACGLDKAFENADLVLTGEGALDNSSFSGKVPAEVAKRCLKKGIPCIAICGHVPKNFNGDSIGLTCAYSLCNGPMSLQEAKNDAFELLESATEQAVKGFLAGFNYRR